MKCQIKNKFKDTQVNAAAHRRDRRERFSASPARRCCSHSGTLSPNPRGTGQLCEATLKQAPGSRLKTKGFPLIKSIGDSAAPVSACVPKRFAATPPFRLVPSKFESSQRANASRGDRVLQSGEGV